MEEIDRVQARLENIRSVEPILSALRTISLGSWQAAQKRQATVHRYAQQLVAMLPALLPHLPPGAHKGRAAWQRLFPRRMLALLGWNGLPSAESVPPERVVALVVGSERGLCGRFNAAVVEYAQAYLVAQAAKGTTVTLVALGSRVRRLLQRRGQPLAWSGRLGATTLPSSALAFELTRRWLVEFEGCELDAVDLIYNLYRGPGHYEPATVRLIPPRLPEPSRFLGDQDARLAEPWPPPIVETDPMGLYARIIEQWSMTSFYARLLESAAAEHSARYQLMEAATQNAERLVEELTMVVQTVRRQSITREMQELAAGAGLVG